MLPHTSFTRLVLAVLLLLLFTTGSTAQVSTATITGTIHDSSGAVIAGAQVDLRNVDTGVERSSTSNNFGTYLIPNVAPGKYTLIVRKEGFATQTVNPFSLQVNQTATVDVELSLGSVAETVTVTAVGAEVQASSAELGAVMQEKQVLDLPLNGRNFTQLLTLTPGASPVSVGQNRGGGQATTVGEVTYPAINGQSNRSNLFLTDGVNNLGAFMGTYGVPPIVDAIQEFKVQSHNDQAEFGMATGGTVNVVTKSGTNDFHGTAWEFTRNDAFDARDPFRPFVTPLRQHMFGATLGGPIVRNKTFFFLGYQGFRNRTPSNTLYRVPTEANLRGDFSDWPRQIFDPLTTRVNPANPGTLLRDPFPDNQIPQNRLDPGFLAYARATLPAPIETGVADRNQLDLTPRRENQEEYNARIDHNFSETDAVWFRINGQVWFQDGSTGRQTLSSFAEFNNYNFGGSWVHTFSPDSILQVQVGRLFMNRTSGNNFNTITSEELVREVGMNHDFCCSFASGRSLMPNISVAQFFSGGERFDNSHPSDIWQFKGNYTKISGKHQLKFGGDFNDINFFTRVNDHDLTFDAAGTANPNSLGNTGSPLASWLLNVPISAARREFNKTTRFGGVLGFFVQDTWRITPRLTMNIGFRYDRTFIPPIGKDEDRTIYMGNYDMSRGVYILQAVPEPCAVVGRAPCLPSPDGRLPANVEVDPRRKLLHDWTDNYQPRFGLAYRLANRTALRGSFGVFFDNWAGVTQSTQNLGHTWPDVGRRLSGNLNTPTPGEPLPTISGKDPFPQATVPNPTPFQDGAFFLDPYFKNSYSLQWNLGVQHQLNAESVLSVNYVGSGNRRLPLGGFYNVALTPGPGNSADRRPFPYINPTNWDRSWARSNYNALQAQFRRSFASGFTAVVNYTWSKAISIGCDGFFGVEGCSVQDPYNFHAERSVAGHDLTHILNVSWVYELPFGAGRALATGQRVIDYIVGGWQFNGIATFHSGQPYTVNVNGDIANTGNQNGYMRPNLTGNPHLDDPTPARWINTAAFAAPERFTFGNAGRNILRSDGAASFDLSVFREFPLPVREAMRLQFRAEAFNAFNTPRFAAPVANVSNSNFGSVLSTANHERQLQLGVKFIF